MHSERRCMIWLIYWSLFKMRYGRGVASDFAALQTGTLSLWELFPKHAIIPNTMR